MQEVVHNHSLEPVPEGDSHLIQVETKLFRQMHIWVVRKFWLCTGRTDETNVTHF